MESTKPLPSGKIRKGLLTPYRTIGLSRKYKIDTFKSPLIQENLVLSAETPREESPVLKDPQSAQNKRKGDDLSNKKAKKNKKSDSTTTNAKKTLIEADFTEENGYLNVSGCELLESDESNRNETVTKETLFTLKDDDLSGKKGKKNKKSKSTNTKKKLINGDLTEKSGYLNISGCELLELDESNKNKIVPNETLSTPVLKDPQSSLTTTQNKGNDDDLSNKKVKKNKKSESTTHTKQNLIKEDLIEVNCHLNVPGNELLELDESGKNETVTNKTLFKPVLKDPHSSSIMSQNKGKDADLSGKKGKKNKKNESTTTNTKKKLMKEDLIKESGYLNVSGSELLELNENNKNETVTKETLPTLKVTLVKLPSNNDYLKKSDIHYEVKCDNNQKVTNKSLKKSQILERVVNPKKSSQTQMVISPKTVSKELETKPLLINSIKSSSSETKSQIKSNSKNSKSIVNSDKKNNLSKNSSKLSLKKTMTESFESDDEFVKEPKSTESLKRSKSINKSELIEKIIKLHKTVGEKESVLEHHKQADIYRKLHDVNKLVELKTVWMNGCKNALNDLLIKSKEFDPNFNMTKLLIRLKVPPGFLKYNEENCNFE